MLLAVVSSIANVALAIELARGVTITWWRSALHGTTLERLHRIWSYHEGMKYPALSGLVVSKVAFATILTTLASIINNPLLQRASHIRNQDIVKNVAMFLDLSQTIPDVFAGTVTYGKPGNTTTEPYFLAAIQQWYTQDPMYTWNDPGYFCNGTCEGNVTSVGLNFTCDSTTEYLDISSPENNGAFLFAINFSRYEDRFKTPTLGLTVRYASAINDSCVATINVDTCAIHTAMISLPILIQNDTVALNPNKSATFVSPYTSSGDSPSAPEGSLAGPLAGLDWFGSNYLTSNATIDHNIVSDQYATYSQGVLGYQYLDTNSLTYTSISICSFQWLRPTMDIISHMAEVLFRAELFAYNGSGTQEFAVQETTPTLVFHSEYDYLGLNIAIMLFTLLVVLFPLWGWWELGRPVSLSPIETAKAFVAPMLRLTSPQMEAGGLVKELGDRRVKYGEVRVCDENGQILSRMELGDPGTLRKPYKGEIFSE